jgi:DNA-binding NarL/FixJ family response regulator
MINLDQVKITPREQQVLNLLVQGCSNKEIGGQLNVKLARYVHEGESAIVTPSEGLTPTEIKISILVWEGLTNREIGKIVGTSEQTIKNHLRSAFDKLGVWTRLELAMYMANFLFVGHPPATRQNSQTQQRNPNRAGLQLLG